MGRATWLPPAPVRGPRPSEQLGGGDWDADLFLTQLRRPPVLPSRDFGPLSRVGELGPRSFVLITVERSRLYAVRTSAPRRLRVVRWNRKLRTMPNVPGVPALPPQPLVETATMTPSATARIRLIAADYRTVEPSTYHPVEYRRRNPLGALPFELEATGLRPDASGWFRANVRYRPSVLLRSLEESGPAYETLWTRRTIDGTHYRRVLTYRGPDGITQDVETGTAATWHDFVDGIVDVSGVETVRPEGVDPRAIAVRDDR